MVCKLPKFCQGFFTVLNKVIDEAHSVISFCFYFEVYKILCSLSTIVKAYCWYICSDLSQTFTVKITQLLKMIVKKQKILWCFF